MLSQTVLTIVYIILIVILVILNSIPALQDYTALYNVQKGFLYGSSFLFILLFFFLRSFILPCVKCGNATIILIGILYTIWYYLTKLITNKISGRNFTFSNLI